MALIVRSTFVFTITSFGFNQIKLPCWLHCQWWVNLPHINPQDYQV